MRDHTSPPGHTPSASSRYHLAPALPNLSLPAWVLCAVVSWCWTQLCLRAGDVSVLGDRSNSGQTIDARHARASRWLSARANNGASSSAIKSREVKAGHPDSEACAVFFIAAAPLYTISTHKLLSSSSFNQQLTMQQSWWTAQKRGGLCIVYCSTCSPPPLYPPALVSLFLRTKGREKQPSSPATSHKSARRVENQLDFLPLLFQLWRTMSK